MVKREELKKTLLDLLSYDCSQCGWSGTRIGWQDNDKGREIIDRANEVKRKLLAERKQNAKNK